MNFLALVGKEMRMLSRNLVFYLLIAVILLFFYGNYATSESWGEGSAPTLPQKQEEQAAPGTPGAEGETGAAASPGAEAAGAGPAASGVPAASGAAAEAGAPAGETPPPMPAYGFKEMTDPGKIAQRYEWTIEGDLKNGWIDQRIIFGAFAHKAKLSNKDRKAMEEAISRFKEVQGEPDKHTAVEVQQIAADLDHELGGWTNYMRDGISFMEGINTYEEAMEQYRIKEAEYRARVEEGQVLPGMARLFCDYMSLTAGLFPVFLAAFALGRDRASRMNELIASRRVRAWTYVGARYLAYALMISIVYLLLSALAAWETSAALDGAGSFGAALPTFLAYGAGWLLPTVWATTAFGMLVYTIFGSGIAAIPLQVAWWLISALPLIGNYGLSKLFLRFNTAGETETYRHYAGDILTNRIFYVILALLMVEAAALLWERRRSSGRSLNRRIRRAGANPTAMATEGNR